MAIGVGDRIPAAKLRIKTDDGVRELTTEELFAGRRVVLFAVPGAFTRACSEVHLPGYLARATDLREAGADTVACVAVNDANVMDAWGRQMGVGDHILMLADGSAHFTRALGLEIDLGEFGLGIRSKRYAALVDDGVVRRLEVEPGPGVTVSAAEAMLDALRAGG